MDQLDGLELAIQRVWEALDLVHAAWQADHPDLPFPEPEPALPAWHPDPNQAPVTTRQWAEVTRLQASALRQEGRQIRDETAQTRQATQRLRGFGHRPPEVRGPGSFTRVGPTILRPTYHR